MTTIRVLSLGVALIWASALPACSSSSGSTGAGDGGTSGSGGGPTPNYCGLIGVPEMAQLSGAPVTHEFVTTSGLGCSYLLDQDGGSTGQGVFLLFFTKDAATSYQAAKQPHGTVVADLPGVGDSAVSVTGEGGGIHQVVAIKGATLLTVTGVVDPAGKTPVSLDSAATIARTIFARLP